MNTAQYYIYNSYIVVLSNDDSERYYGSQRVVHQSVRHVTRADDKELPDCERRRIKRSANSGRYYNLICTVAKVWLQIECGPVVHVSRDKRCPRSRAASYVLSL